MSVIDAHPGVGAATQAEAESNFLRALAFDFWQRKNLILACSALGLVLSFAYSVTIRSSYEARARLLIQQRRPDVTPGADLTLTAVTPEWVETQLQLIRGRDLSEKVLASFVSERRDRMASELRSGPIRSWIEILRSKLGFEPPVLPSTPDIPMSPEAFQNRVFVRMVPRSSLFELTFRSYDPWLAAEAANTLADAFVAQRQLEQKSVSVGAVEWIEGQLVQQKERQATKVDKLRAFERGSGITNLEEQRKLAAARVESAQGPQMMEARSNLAAKEAQMAQLMAMSPAEIAGLPDAQRSPGLAQLVREIADMEARRSVLAIDLGEKHPERAALEARLRAANARLNTETRGIIRVAQADLAAAQRRVSSLQQVVDAAERDLQDLGRQSVEWMQLKEEADAETKLAESLADQGRQTRLESEVDDTIVRIVERALVPKSPTFPNRLQNMQLGALLGLGGGLLIVFAMRRLDQTFQGADDVRAALGVKVLATIPAVETQVAARSAGSSAPSPLAFAFDESFAVLRTAVLVAASARDQKVFLLSSAGPGEGKSTVAYRLADSLARLGKKTLLIDGDLRRPTLHHRLSTSLHPGLSDVLTGASTLAAAIRTFGPALSLLPAGRLPGTPADLVADKAFRGLLEEARARYDFVILDGPPTLGMTDSLAMIGLADFLAVVVSCGQTPMSAAKEMARQIEALGYRIDGAIVNRVDARRHAYSYAYSYSYSYFKQGQDKTKERPRPTGRVA